MPFQRHNPSSIDGLLVITPQVFRDPRGFFMEAFSQRDFAEMGIEAPFVQDNLSYSQQGTVRGLHFQAPPSAQAKLVTVFQGRVRDVAVDIRRDSPTYGQHFALELDADTPTLFFIPAGFAHGFSVLSETCLFYYKCSGYYDKPAEGGLRWNDPLLGIDWGVAEPIVSDKDQQYPGWDEFVSPF